MFTSKNSTKNKKRMNKGISRLFSDSSQGKLCKQDFSRFESVDIQLLIEKQLRESLSEIFLNDLLLLWNL